MPIPNKGFFDPEPTPEKPLDSTVHNQERLDAMRKQSALDNEEQEKKNAQYKADEEKRQATMKEEEIGRLESYAHMSRDEMTREMILQRIREMRNEKPPEYVPPPRTPEQQALYERECEAGRAAVAKAEAEIERNREAQRKYEESERLRAGEQKQVVHPNEPEKKAFPDMKRLKQWQH